LKACVFDAIRSATASVCSQACLLKISLCNSPGFLIQTLYTFIICAKQMAAELISPFPAGVRWDFYIEITTSSSIASLSL
jgi:hypothetical protein